MSSNKRPATELVVDHIELKRELRQHELKCLDTFVYPLSFDQRINSKFFHMKQHVEGFKAMIEEVCCFFLVCLQFNSSFSVLLLQGKVKVSAFQ